MTTALLVVDVQPAFNSHCEFVASRVAQRINNTRKPTFIVWVGDDLSDDDENSVREYLRAHGARPGRLDRCVFVEKGYGFFRPWMDQAVDPEVIVSVGKEMIRARASSSADLDMVDVTACHDLPEDPIHLPYFESDQLLQMSNFETCGGGNNECLAEIELWLEMNSKSFTRLDHLIYG